MFKSGLAIVSMLHASAQLFQTT